MTRLSVCSLGVSCNEMIDTPMLLVVFEAQPEELSRKTKGNRILLPGKVLPRIQCHCLAPPPKIQLR